MLDLRDMFVATEGFCNPTIKEGIKKIKINNLTPTKKNNIPFKIIEYPDYYKNLKTQNLLIILIFNQL